jgi:dTDP-4-amino-4,6-dideoxygalactose transaminase
MRDRSVFFDLETPKMMLRADIETRWQKILDHGAFIGGPEVGELEAQLRRGAGAKHALAVASGTDALVIALMGEEVDGDGRDLHPRASPYNATANAVLVAGATPIFVDVDADTCNMDPAHLEAQVEAVRARGQAQAAAW